MSRAATWCIAFCLALFGSHAEAGDSAAQAVVTGDAEVENADILRIGETRIIL